MSVCCNPHVEVTRSRFRHSSLALSWSLGAFRGGLGSDAAALPCRVLLWLLEVDSVSDATALPCRVLLGLLGDAFFDEPAI